MSEKQMINSLTDLGFPTSVAKETSEADDLGMFSLEPSSDLVDRTLASCIKAIEDSLTDASLSKFAELPAEIDDSVVAAYEMIVEDTVDFIGRDKSPSLAALSYVATNCFNSMNFSHRAHRLPAILIDNHNVVAPHWWETDSGFAAIRDAWTLQTVVGQRPMVIVVLRESLGSYEERDLQALASRLPNAHDVWVLPSSFATEYNNTGVFAFGEECTLSVHGRFPTPSATFHALHKADKKSAPEIRERLETLWRRLSNQNAQTYYCSRQEGELRKCLGRVIDEDQPVKMNIHN